MKVTENDVKVVASLSRLKINAEESVEVIAQLDKFLTYVENLQSIDTTEIEPTTYAVPMKNVFPLSNAPLKDEGYFKVPRVLEE